MTSLNWTARSYLTYCDWLSFFFFNNFFYSFISLDCIGFKKFLILSFFCGPWIFEFSSNCMKKCGEEKKKSFKHFLEAIMLLSIRFQNVLWCQVWEEKITRAARWWSCWYVRLEWHCFECDLKWEPFCQEHVWYGYLRAVSKPGTSIFLAIAIFKFKSFFFFFSCFWAFLCFLIGMTYLLLCFGFRIPTRCTQMVRCLMDLIQDRMFIP